jgi:hypothetical protein
MQIKQTLLGRSRCEQLPAAGTVVEWEAGAREVHVGGTGFKKGSM